WREYEASLAAGDADRWMDLWADGGVKLSPGLPPIVGKDAIREYITPRVEAFAYDMTITNEEIEVGGGWAIARGGYIATLTPKAGGDVIPVDGKYMTLLQQQDDGSWKIYRDITNSNVPPAPAPTTDVDEVTEAVNAIWREYEASLLADDAERWIALWADDGVRLPPNAPVVEGKEAIFAGISSRMETIQYTAFVITPEELTVNGDIAISRGVYEGTFVAKAGGDPMQVDGKFMTFLRQQPDGTWKIYRDIFNSNE
ncbi:MAG TPA: nuclear transport factor 2 family protein, partial [Caldilineaceae bacterium]|nr:nuclear transport factor 2 family protein [Caldilineaceae bacterium]